MQISYSWLGDFFRAFSCKEALLLDEKALSGRLTSLGLEVEHVGNCWEVLEGFSEKIIWGLLRSFRGEEGGEEGEEGGVRWWEVSVWIGGEEKCLDIACSASNIAQGYYVAVALPGAKVRMGGEWVEVESKKIGARISQAVLCSAYELGLSKDYSGVFVGDIADVEGISLADYAKGLHSARYFDIGLTPNRGDASSHYGIARDVCASFRQCPQGFPFSLSDIPIRHFPSFSSPSPIGVQILCKEACGAYGALAVNEVKVGPSPASMQHRLAEIGLGTVNNIVDVGNIILHGIGQPVHAFDADCIQGTISVCTLKERPSLPRVFKALNEVEYKVEEQDILICDEEKILALGGIIGGFDSKIRAMTSRIVLEVAYFDPVYIRRTAKRLDLHTDSSFRYERGCDSEMIVPAMRASARYFSDIAQGKGYAGVLCEPKKASPHAVVLRLGRLEKQSGCKIASAEIAKILHALSIRVVEKVAGKWTLEVPFYRYDVRREIDVIEEVLRLYGYDNIKGAYALSYRPAFHTAQWPYALEREVGVLLSSWGFLEIMTSSIPSAVFLKQAEGSRVPVWGSADGGSGGRVLRSSLWETAQACIAHNFRHRQRDIRFFEFGRTYHKDAKEKGGYIERAALALYMSGNYAVQGWRVGGRSLTIYDAMDVVERLWLHMGWDIVRSRVSSRDLHGMLVEEAVEWVDSGRVLACAAQWEALEGQKVYAIYVHWAEVLALRAERADKGIRYVPISLVPEVRRDLSVVLSLDVSYMQMKAVIDSVGADLHKRMGVSMKDIRVFSVYTGAPLKEDERSYALSLLLQGRDTLSESAIQACMSALMDALREELGAVIRS